MKNKRGLSAVIVTLLLVMLSIVLVGVVFVVVRNVISSGTSQAQSGFNCATNTVNIQSAYCTQDGQDCNVTVQRDSGSDVVGGVTLVFYNAAGDSAVNNTAGNIQLPAAKRIPNINASVTNVTRIDAAVYYNDKSGNPSTCSGAFTFDQVNIVS